jgi:outer membrane biosynthesis protein TonB
MTLVLITPPYEAIEIALEWSDSAQAVASNYSLIGDNKEALLWQKAADEALALLPEIIALYSGPRLRLGESTMVSTTKNSMRIKHVQSKKKTLELSESSVEEQVESKADDISSPPEPEPEVIKKPKKEKSATTKKPRKTKAAPPEKKSTSPEDAILQSVAVDPDIKKASKARKTSKTKKSATSRKKSKKPKS